MKIVADTNVLFSFFWENSFTKRLISRLSGQIISSEYALSELKKYKSEIIKKTSLNSKKFDELLKELKELITFFPSKEYINYLKESLNISPDKKDAEFIALAMKNSCPLWSNDLLLKKQNKVYVITTEELVRLI